MDAEGPRSARRALILLVVLAGSLLALSIVQRDRALEQVYEDAERRAELYAGTVVRNAVGFDDVGTELDPAAADLLFSEIQAFVLVPDPTVARVRLWKADGTLIFSTDPNDEPGVVSRDPAIVSASDGRPASRLAVEALSRSTVESDVSDTPLFQTFVPLRVQGGAAPPGAVEVEQFSAELERRADDPWWLVQLGASAATVLLALMAFVSVARSMRHPVTPPSAGRTGRMTRRSRRASGWEGETGDLRQQLDRATARAEEAEGAAKSFAAKLQQVTARLEIVERQSSDERVSELKEELRRSEAERAMLRSGRPETLVEAEVRELRNRLREAESLAKAAEALVAGGGDLGVVQAQLSQAARQVEIAQERARIAEGRADAAEERASSAGEIATAAEHRIDLLEVKLQEIAAAGATVTNGDAGDTDRRLAEAQARAAEMEARAVQAEDRLASSMNGPSAEAIRELEERLMAAEERGSEATDRVRALEEREGEDGSAFRHRLGVTAAGRKLAAPASTTSEGELEVDLQAAVARGLRAPLTRATGLALSLQGFVAPGEGKSVVRELATALRRLDRLMADLHEIHRIADGTLPLDRRRVDLAGLVTTTVDETDRLEDRLVRVDTDNVFARVDAARTRQIIEGMLDAAHERTRAGAAIVVRLRDTDAGARISVEDDNRTPAVVGSDMALAVRLAELHGTEVVADGSGFRVVFPKDDDL